MPRAADPGVAARLTTGVSREERAALERIARDMRVELATVVRWAVIDYLARTAQNGQPSQAPREEAPAAR